MNTIEENLVNQNFIDIGCDLRTSNINTKETSNNKGFPLSHTATGSSLTANTE